MSDEQQSRDKERYAIRVVRMEEQQKAILSRLDHISRQFDQLGRYYATHADLNTLAAKIDSLSKNVAGVQKALWTVTSVIVLAVLAALLNLVLVNQPPGR